MIEYTNGNPNGFILCIIHAISLMYLQRRKRQNQEPQFHVFPYNSSEPSISAWLRKHKTSILSYLWPNLRRLIVSMSNITEMGSYFFPFYTQSCLQNMIPLSRSKAKKRMCFEVGYDGLGSISLPPSALAHHPCVGTSILLRLRCKILRRGIVNWTSRRKL